MRTHPLYTFPSTLGCHESKRVHYYEEAPSRTSFVWQDAYLRFQRSISTLDCSEIACDDAIARLIQRGKLQVAGRLFQRRMRQWLQRLSDQDAMEYANEP